MPQMPLDQVLVILLILAVAGLSWLMDGEALGVWWRGRQQAGPKSVVMQTDNGDDLKSYQRFDI